MREQNTTNKAAFVGYVRDAVTREGLPGAHVYVTRDGLPVGTTTNLEGAFVLEGVNFGERVTVSYVGYRTATFAYDGGGVEVLLDPGVGLPEVEIFPEDDDHRAGLGILAAALLLLALASSDQ